MDDPGFDFSVLSEFRDRMAEGDRADRLLAVMVERLVEAGLVKRHGRQRTDSTHILAAVRRLDRIELVGETRRAALEELTVTDEEWVAARITDEWARRYGRPVRYDRLPKETKERERYALTVGEDGMRLFHALLAPDAPARLRRLPKVEVLRQVWIQQYWYDETGGLRWRGPKQTRDRLSRRSTDRRSASGATAGRGSPDPASATVPWSPVEIVSPHDPQARFSHKPGKAEWVGYKDHQTETCDEGLPNVIVHVATTPAPEQDIDALEPIHADLAARDLAPAEHLVDGGYTTPAAIHRARTEYGIDLVGPVRVGPVSRSRPGFNKEDFHPNWAEKTLTCPNGATSPPWKPTLADGQPRLSVLFPRAVCRPCEDRLKCTGNVDGKGRHVLLLPQPLQEIQNRVRKEQQTRPWHDRYALRAGCEATVSETVHAHGLRHCRYRGIAKTHVQHVLTAAGTNIIRLHQHQPDSDRTRDTTRFTRLCRNLSDGTRTRTT
ncbi:transposase [Kitasatospora phosalacinea]|uniref:transposase n=1 Tax=Kitasatospora phosalacinea TaxID=2065 RepID=UPI0012FF231C|nr:transposase [Kitasatospora phosalacinea]